MSRVDGWPNKPRPKSTATDCARIVAAERKVERLGNQLRDKGWATDNLTAQYWSLRDMLLSKDRAIGNLETQAERLGRQLMDRSQKIGSLRSRIVRLKERIDNQRKRIVYLEGATNHATGTPLTRATLEIGVLERKVEDRDLVIDSRRRDVKELKALLATQRELYEASIKREEELKLQAAISSFTGEDPALTKIKATAFAGGFSLGLKFSGIIEKSSGVLFEMDGVLFDMDGEESDA